MLNKRTPPEVNAGSMADIAFLLLIFFLVTTSIETDAGLSRLLPDNRPIDSIEIRQRNLFEISLNGKDELLVEGELMNINSLRRSVYDFVDNGGTQKGNEGYCSYCKGERSPKSSDNPDKAIILVTTNRKTNYATYVAVQNEVIGAYNDLRNREALQKFGITYTEMVESYIDNEIASHEKERLKERIEHLRIMYPQKIIEGQITNQIH